MPVSRDAVRYLSGAASSETDAELLRRFIDRRDEAAFALLVRRHGAMVYGVCRRILPTDQDAEDAFQATFLVLARKAGVAPREVASWLYGVARRAALLSRRSIARRREHVGGVPERPATPLDELRAVLDEELGRLPDAYRTVLVLCDLEGRTRREAAAMLGWPEGTVAGRLVRARELLARRLAPAVSIAALLTGPASARVPEVLAPGATIPPRVAALTREVLGVLVRGKLMKTAAAVLLLGCAGFGMFLQVGQTPGSAEGAPVPARRTTAPANPPMADDVAWGKEVDGLQAGLSLLPGEKRTYRLGEAVTLVVRVRNVGKGTVQFEYIKQFLDENPPTVTDAGGKTIAQGKTAVTGLVHAPVEVSLDPGKEVVLESRIHGADGLRYELLPAGGGGKPTTRDFPLHVRTGKVSLQYERVLGDSSIGRIKLDPALSKLATGKLELEVTSDPRPR